MLKLYKWFLCALVVLNFSMSAMAADRYPLTLINPDGREVRLEVEMARTQKQRSIGLMDRSNLPKGQGMLFDFHRPVKVRMWMHRTYIPLDMVFIDEHGYVVGVHENAQPHDKTVIASPGLVRFVLEIGGGEARGHGIVPSAQIRSKEMDLLSKKP